MQQPSNFILPAEGTFCADPWVKENLFSYFDPNSPAKDVGRIGLHFPRCGECQKELYRQAVLRVFEHQRSECHQPWLNLLIPRYFKGVLEGQELAELREHFKVCQWCNQCREILKKALELIRRTR